MGLHPEVARIAASFAARELHASRGGREVMRVLVSVISDSEAASVEGLAQDLRTNTEALLGAMPAYAPPTNVIHEVYSLFEQAQNTNQPLDMFRSAVAEAQRSYLEWSEDSQAAIARSILGVIPANGTVFTFTLSETVLTALRSARSKVPFKVLVTESRPNNDGLETAYALASAGIDVDVGIDAALGDLIPKADVVLVGAESILSDGSAICKVGTYPCALVANRSRIPVIVLADSRKFQPTSGRGMRPRFDPIESAEVVNGPQHANTKTQGHLFDTTPPDLITAIATEFGLIPPSQVAGPMLRMPLSEEVALWMRYHQSTQGAQ